MKIFELRAKITKKIKMDPHEALFLLIANKILIRPGSANSLQFQLILIH